METGIKHLHSTLAYIAIALLLLTILVALFKLLGNKEHAGLKKLATFALIATHTQFLVGLISYFTSPLGMKNFSGENMGDSISRLYMLEHPLTMLIGIVLITIGNAKAKKALGDQKKNKTILIFFALGLILILSRIPWHVWPPFLG
jgi:heme A synthase